MKTQLAALFVLIMTISHSSAAVIDKSTTVNSYCTSEGKTSWKFDKLTSSTTPASFDFDYTSAFLDQTNGDSVPLMLRKPTATAPFTFISLDKKTLATTEKTCKDTLASDGYEFLQFKHQSLFLKKGAEYFLCIYDTKDPSSQFPLLKLVPAQNIGTITSLNLLDHINMMDMMFGLQIIWGGAAKKSAVSYTIMFTPDRSVPPTVNANPTGQVFDDASVSMSGTSVIPYSPAKGVFLSSASAFAPYTQITIVYPTNPLNYKEYILRNSVVIRFFNSTTSSKLYWARGVSLSQITWASTTATPYVEYYEGVSNIMISGSVNTLWLTLAPGMNSQFIKTEIPAAELAVANDEIQDIALSGNVATIFYKNTIRYLKHTSSGKVDQLFEKTITSTDIDYDTSLQMAVRFSCMCASLKRFACFSSTLNCLIVKKSSATCSSEGAFVPVA